MYKVLHIHPLRKCNLQCLHCYTSSSPQATEELDIRILRQAIADAAQEGYTMLGVSGGEPMLYKSLEELLEAAHCHQMKTSVVSNGILLTKKRLSRLQGLVDIIAISLDGRPKLHDRMRNQPDAFSSMEARLSGLRQSGIPFGFVFTISRYNFRDLDWAVDFALKHRARLIRFHLLEEAGRAKQNLPDAELDETIAAYVYLQIERLQKRVGDRLNIHVDLVHQEAIRANQERFQMLDKGAYLADLPLAELISALVIETDGSVVPLQHGMPRKYKLGNIKDSSIKQLASQWRDKQSDDFRELYQQAYQNLLEPSEFPIKNYFQSIYQQAVNNEQNERVTV